MTVSAADRDVFRKLARARDYKGVQHFIDATPDIITGDFLWLDRALRSDISASFKIRRKIWEDIFAQRDDLHTLLLLMDAASSARDLEFQLRVADRLEEISVKPSGTTYADYATRIGEVRLLEKNYAAAQQWFDRALSSKPEYSRALAGNLSIEMDLNGNAVTGAFLLPLMYSIIGDSNGQARKFIQSIKKVWDADRAKNPSIEAFVFTHVTNKLSVNKLLGAPSVGLVSASITSFRERLHFAGRPITVMFDSKGTTLDEEYEQNLREWCGRNGVEVVTNYCSGLRKQWLDAFRRARADIIAIVEQDHLFLETCPQASDLIEIFLARHDLNYLRLNRRTNKAIRWDRLLIEPDIDHKIGVCRTARFSNTPHLQRKLFFDEVIHPIIADNQTIDSNNGGAAGVEENINRVLQDVERLIGLPATTRLLGNAIYGAIGNPATVMHLGV